MAVGDIMLGENPACDGFGVASMIRRHGPRFPFERCRGQLQSADILFGNLEVVISAFDRGHVAFDQSIFRAQPESVEGLTAAGFDILSLATNHIMQHGKAAFDECLDHLARAGIAVTGIARPEKDARNFRMIEKNGLRIGFLGYNQRPQQYFLDPPCYVPGDPDKMLTDITSARNQVDFLAVSVHWGDEFIDYPSPDQVSIAHRMVDTGADLVIGHHPHVLQGIERYKNGVIAYSLGNFVFDMWQPRMRHSAIFKCTLVSGGRLNYEIIPVEINSRWQPEVVTGEQATQRLVEMNRLSELISSETQIDTYRTELRQREQAYRRDIYKWYLTHLFRYPPNRLFANFGRILGRRLYHRKKGSSAIPGPAGER